MEHNYLEKLHNAVYFLLGQVSFLDTVQKLKNDVTTTREPFVWSTVPLSSIATELPASIKSCWIFVLKKDTSSECHYHPNSIQHMISIEGEGISKIDGVKGKIVVVDSEEYALEEKWLVIKQGVGHEFIPEKTAMTVVSFHTCEVDELEEVACKTGKARLYESFGNA